MTQIVDRLESMSPSGFLRLFIQDDWDVVLQIQQDDGEHASVEFCTYAGGGGSPRTHKALLDLARAMAEDNADPACAGRRGEFDGQEMR